MAITMHEPLTLMLSTVAGMAIGGMFFGGLWWTVRKTISASAPALWLFASLLVRIALALAGFFYVAGGLWQRWLACLVGFIVARAVVTALTRPMRAPEASHAP
jgi:F1F0 ATPase subunit 2